MDVVDCGSRMKMGFVLGEGIGPYYLPLCLLCMAGQRLSELLPSRRFLAHRLALTSTKVPYMCLVF